MKLTNILEEIDSEYDPCIERTVKFYQSSNGKELLSILREYFDNQSVDGKTKMDRFTKRRFRFLMSLVPKC